MSPRVLALAILPCLAVSPPDRAQAQPSGEPLALASPSGRAEVELLVGDDGLRYSVRFDQRDVILPSRLGFRFREAPPLEQGLEVVQVTRESRDRTWEQPWGEQRLIRDHHNELTPGTRATPRSTRACWCSPGCWRGRSTTRRGSST